MPNPNHPKKGSIIKTEPIRELKDIRNIKKLLADKPRDLAIFVIGCNTALRSIDLLKLKVGQVRHLKVGDSLCVREQKTGKSKDICINNAVFDVVQKLLKHLGEEAKDTDYLFQSRKSRGKLSTPTLNAMVKSWCKDIRLKINAGSHTLRRTAGYQHRVQFNTDVPTLMVMFNHSTQRQTLSYLGIQEQDVQDAYMKEI